MPETYEYQIDRVGQDWILSAGDVTLTATENGKKRNGYMSVLLTVDQGAHNLYTDTVTLTDLAARKRVVKALAPYSVPIEERMLRALYSAIRQTVAAAAAANVAPTGKRKAVM